MKLDNFKVESWMTLHEQDCLYNLADTCVNSLSLEDLFKYCDNSKDVINQLLKIKLNYGPIEGSLDLKEKILKLYDKGNLNNIAISHGCISANELVLTTLLSKDDHLICIKPTYQQLYSLPNSYGVKTDFVELKEEKNWEVRPQQFEELINNKTKMICLTNPNNPTGTTFSKTFLIELVEIAKKHNLYILCDEAYKGVGEDEEVSISDIYDYGISTASLSKTLGFAGIRLGWIKGPSDLIVKINERRDYHMISTGHIYDYLGTLVLDNYKEIHKRSLEICKTNRGILKQWLEEEKHISCVLPRAGTIAFLKYDIDMPSAEFCIKLQEETGVFFVPGSCFDEEYHLRFGLGNDPIEVKKGLTVFSDWLKQFDK